MATIILTAETTSSVTAEQDSEYAVSCSSRSDHRIASFDWPFDSVRGFFINLSSHPAYKAFRRLRADRKAAGKPIRSLVMAQGLINYSERGQE